VSKFLKGHPSEWLDGEPVDSDVSRKILGAYDRAAYRAPKQAAVRSVLARVEAFRAQLNTLISDADSNGLDGLDLFDEADKCLWIAQGKLRGTVPEAATKRTRGNPGTKPGELAVRKSLDRAIGLGKSWQFTAALLVETGKLTGEWGKVYDQVRKVFERRKPSDANR